MDSILASAHTWFLESYQQGPYGDLVLRLAEGIKGKDPQPVHVGEKVLGPYFPVTIEPHSRCVSVRFRDLRSLLTFTEGYDAEDPKMELGPGKFLRQVTSSSFRSLTAATTSAIDEFRGQYSEWLVWTEEQIFQVLCGEPPEVVLEDRSPDFSIERGGSQRQQSWLEHCICLCLMGPRRARLLPRGHDGRRWLQHPYRAC